MRSPDATGNVGVEVVREIESLGRRGQGHELERGLDALPQVERRLLELEPAGLDLREVQDVVDHGEQRIAAPADHLGELPLLRGELGVQQSPVIPITAFNGVRISWLIVARNALLASVAASASSRRWSSPTS